jgi:hypothetical protein
MTMLDDCLKASLVTIAKGLESFEMAAIQCEFRIHKNGHCTHEGYPEPEAKLGAFNCLPCLYAFCPRAHSKE